MPKFDRRRVAAALALAFVCVLLLSPLLAPAADAELAVEGAFEPTTTRLGEHVVLRIDAAPPAGYHLYTMTKIPDGPLRTQVKLSEPGLEPVGEWYAPKPKVEHDLNFKKQVEYYDAKASHRRAFKVVGELSGETIEISLRAQICDERQCIPIKQKLTLALKLEPGDPRAAYAAAPELPGEAFPDDRPPPSGGAGGGAGDDGEGLPMSGGLIGFLVIAFLAGLGALVTPCVFPMIPITISFFSKFAKVSLRRSVTMAFIYAGSIILCFTLIGILVSAIFGAVGMQTLSASPWFNLFLTALLIVFAFNLFGLFEIQVPSWLISRSSQKEHELTAEDGSLFRQSGGVFFMAITFTLVSFTCTVGFIGIVLAEAAKGNWFYPAIGMLAFSFAFSLPFFFLAVFPSWADKLKGKGGDWMVAVKVILGFLEFAGAFKFLSNVDLVWQWGMISRPLVLALWVGIFFLAGLYLLRVFNLPHSDPEARHVGPIRMFFALLMFSLSAYAATGIRTTDSMGGWLDGWLPPAIYPGEEAAASAGESDHLAWIVDDIDKGMEVARAENKPLFVDFTGYTCTNCRYMEGAVFPKPNVRSRLEKMVLVTAYTDGADEVNDKQREYQIKRFDTAALPFYAIIDPFTDEVLAKHPDMTKDLDKYIEFLDGGLAKFEAQKPKDVSASAPANAGATGGSSTSEVDDHAEAAPAAEADHDGGPAAEGHEKVDLTISAAGEPVDFAFPYLKDGKPFKLSSLRGGWVFVNLWASWCAPCKKELMNDFPPALAGAPQIKLVTVAFDGDETKDAALKFAEEAKLFQHVTLQGGEDIEEAGLDEKFQVSESLPISYLIHPQGHIAWMLKGSIHKEMLIELFAKTKPAGE